MSRTRSEIARSFSGGYLNINKPSGWTSTDVVRKLKGITKIAKIGHGGTLDPIASGVLAICLGPATKFADMFLLGDKEYRLTVQLGAETDTYDSEGTVTLTKPFEDVTLPQIERVVAAGIGQVAQVPPMYSAIKHNGRRLYEMARRGIEVERKPRLVTLMSAVVCSFEPPTVEIDLRCSHGFYARTYAHDLGRALGTAAHLTGLIRTRSGRLSLEDACTIDDIQQLAREGRWEEATLPIDFTLAHIRRVDLDPLRAEMVRHGRQLGVSELSIEPTSPAEQIRVYEDDSLIALMRWDPGKAAWRPEKVLSSL